MDVKLFLEYLPWLRKPDFYYISKKGIGGWDEQQIAEAIAGQANSYAPRKREMAFALTDAPAEF